MNKVRAIAVIFVIAVVLAIAFSPRTDAPIDTTAAPQPPVAAAAADPTPVNAPEAPDDPEPVAETADTLPESPNPESPPDHIILTGRVYNKSTNAGLAGVTVYAEGQGDERGVTNAEGIYRLDPIAPGNWKLRIIEGPSSLISRELGIEHYVTLRELGEHAGPDFALDIQYVVRGQVEDAQGAVIPEVNIAAESVGAHMQSKTDAEGKFVVYGNAPGKMTIRARKDGYATVVADPIEVESGGEYETRIVMGEGALIAGTVVDRNGQPVPNPVVNAFDTNGQAYSEKAGPYLMGGGLMANDHVFRIPGLPAGEYRIYVTAMPPPDPSSSHIIISRGPNSSTQPDAVVTVQSGEHREDLVITLDIATPGADAYREVFGTVTDDLGHPVAGVQVYWQFSGSTSRTDADGRYRFRVPKRERGKGVRINDPKYKLFYSKVMVEEDEPFDIMLTRVFPHKGRVFNVDSGEALAEFSFEVRPCPRHPQTGLYRRMETVTGTGGEFDFVYNLDYPACIVVRANGYLPVDHHLQEEPVADTVIEIPVEPGPTIRGIVLDPNGNPLSAALVGPAQVIGKFDDYTYERRAPGLVYSGADGRFELPFVGVDTISLMAVHKAYPPTATPVELKRDSVVEVELQFEPGNTIRGRAYRPDGPVTNRRVTLEARGDTHFMNKEAITDEDGNYAFTGLVDGTWRVYMHYGESQREGGFIESYSDRSEVTLSNNAVHVHDFNFQDWSTEITGTVSGLQPEIETLTVSVRNRDYRGRAEMLDNGAYRLSGMPPGTYDVLAVAERADGSTREDSAKAWIVENRTSELDLNLGSAQGIRGTITAPHNAEFVHVVVYEGTPVLEELKDLQAVAEKQVNGMDRFIINLTKAGTYTIFAVPTFADRSITMEPADAVVVLEPNQYAELQFTF